MGNVIETFIIIGDIKRKCNIRIEKTLFFPSFEMSETNEKYAIICIISYKIIVIEYNGLYTPIDPKLDCELSVNRFLVMIWGYSRSKS